MPNYGEATYWDERYTKQRNQTFDWLEGWSDIRDIIEQNAVESLLNEDLSILSKSEAHSIKMKLKVLNLGCGNSIMCEDMYDEGYIQIENIDISDVCIKMMSNRNSKSRPHMNWKTMDCRDLKYPSETFDFIIDKSTIDALLCGNNAFFNVAIMLKEC